jgi:hypothetical protein
VRGGAAATPIKGGGEETRPWFFFLMNDMTDPTPAVCPQPTETLSAFRLTERFDFANEIASDEPIAKARECACFLRGTHDAEKGLRTHNRRQT